MGGSKQTAFKEKKGRETLKKQRVIDIGNTLVFETKFMI